MDVVVYDEEDRRYVPALLMLLLVAGAALLAATVTYLVVYNPSSTTTAKLPGPAALVPAAPSRPSGTTPPLGVSDPQAGATPVRRRSRRRTPPCHAPSISTAS